MPLTERCNGPRRFVRPSRPATPGTVRVVAKHHHDVSEVSVMLKRLLALLTLAVALAACSTSASTGPTTNGGGGGLETTAPLETTSAS